MCVVRLDYSNRVVNKGLEDIFPDQVIQPESEELRPQSLPASTIDSGTSLNSTCSANDIRQLESSCGVKEGETRLLASSYGSWTPCLEKNLLDRTTDVTPTSTLTATENECSTVVSSSTARFSNRKRLLTYIQELQQSRDASTPRRQTVSEFPIIDLKKQADIPDSNLADQESTSSSKNYEKETSFSNEREVVGGISGLTPFQWERLLKPAQKPRKTSALDLLLMTESEAKQFRVMGPSEFFSCADVPKFPTHSGSIQETTLFTQALTRNFQISSSSQCFREIGRISGIGQLSNTAKASSSKPLHYLAPGSDTTSFSIHLETPSTSSFIADTDLSDRPQLRLSESAKCRRVYGAINKTKWCKQCRWKKACTRFQSGRKTSE